MENKIDVPNHQPGNIQKNTAILPRGRVRRPLGRPHVTNSLGSRAIGFV